MVIHFATSSIASINTFAKEVLHAERLSTCWRDKNLQKRMEDKFDGVRDGDGEKALARRDVVGEVVTVTDVVPGIPRTRNTWNFAAAVRCEALLCLSTGLVNFHVILFP